MGKNSNSFLILLVIFFQALQVTALSSDEDEQQAFEIFASSVFNSSPESEEEQPKAKTEPEKGENSESSSGPERNSRDDEVIVCRFIEGDQGRTQSLQPFWHLGPLDPLPAASPLCPAGIPKLPEGVFLMRNQLEPELLGGNESCGTSSNSSEPTILTAVRSRSAPLNKQPQPYRETIFGAFGTPPNHEEPSSGPAPLTSQRSQSVPLNRTGYRQTIFGSFGEAPDELCQALSSERYEPNNNEKYQPPRKLHKPSCGNHETSTSFSKKGKKQLQKIGNSKHFNYGDVPTASQLEPEEMPTLEEAYNWQGTTTETRRKTRSGTFQCFKL